MNGKDRNTKKIISSAGKKKSEMRAEHSVREKPSEKVRKYFERKAYTKM